MPQCCARVWDRKNEDGTITRGVGGCCSKQSTGEVFTHDGKTFYFCGKCATSFKNNPELAVNPRYKRTEAHSIKSQKKADRLGFEAWKPVLWLGVFKDSEDNLLERPMPADCEGEFSKAPLRWTDVKHFARQERY